MDLDALVRIGLLLARPSMLVMTAPTFGGHSAPPHVRVGLSALLAILALPLVPVPVVPGLAALGVVVMRELAIGLALGLSVRAILAGAELGGHITSGQLMLSYGSLIDPQGGARNTLLATLYGNLALLTFFVINGHHILLRGLAASYQALPIGVGAIDGSLATSVMRLLGVVFIFGLRLAAPIIVVMLVVELATGLVSKAAPALNLMVVGTPVRLIVGLLTVAAIVPQIPGVTARFVTAALEAGRALAQAFR
ncbi:MAG TPA: flagellar biosynthetic protein FliR [Vicinamibacterales bacterium]|mgnify:CR=1 FL=1|nr:flagellar biosynthetic protein FliR [Vicinamibacterales bacterium]